MSPLKISIKDKAHLHIDWDDNTESLVPLKSLRKNCPCATCIEDRRHRPANYIPLYSGATLTLADIKPVGSYAIQLFWKDGHNTGIFRFELLRDLAVEFPL